MVLYLYNFFFYDIIKYKIKYHSYYKFFNNKWYFNNIYNFFIGKFSFNLGYNFFFIILEQGVFEPTGVNNMIYKASIISSKFLNENIHRYVFFIIINFFIFLVLLLFLVL